MCSRLKIVRKYDNFPQFQQPVIIGCFCLNENREYISNLQNLKYLHKINDKVTFDLNTGYETFIPQCEPLENEEKISSILLWLDSHQYLQNMIDNKPENCTFICFRGILSTIMRTPYEQQEDWFIIATKVNNIIFLCAFYTDEKKRSIQLGKSPKDKRFSYWGYKFEQYMLADNPTQKPDTSKPVNANEEFGLIYRSKLGEHNILYGAEIDGVESDVLIDFESQINMINPEKFIELKTSRYIQHKKQDRNFKKYKLLKWWSQCFVVGIENIICGFRNDTGIVHKLEIFKTNDLPKISNNLWSSTVCMRFLEDFLCFVSETMTAEPDLTQRRFDWKPTWKHVLSEKITRAPPYEVLPDWFIKKFSGLDG